MNRRPNKRYPFHQSRGPLATILPMFPRRCQLAVAFGVDLLLAPGQHVGRRDEADRAVQAHGVVVIHVLLNQPPRILRRQRRSRPDALAFQRFVPALDFSVRLRIVGRCPHMRHARDSNELLEVPGDELRTVVGDDARLGLRVFLFGSLAE